MRHVAILLLASLGFAFMTAVAWQHDTARALQGKRERQQAMDTRLLALETDYLRGARSLLALVPADHSPAQSSMASLLEEIDAVLAHAASASNIDAREAAFDAVVARIGDVLLRVEPEAFGNSIAQEWRRQNDRMNGALHRRKLLLDQGRDSP
jgi:hypothetical protein